MGVQGNTINKKRFNPSCVASCPSGALYKREEDGSVLVDQDACQGWRYCMKHNSQSF